jgi:hypothetical protein
MRFDRDALGGGKLILNVLMSVAQWEREAIGERTQEALSELKRQGVRLGGAPYGWRYSNDVDEHGRRYLRSVGVKDYAAVSLDGDFTIHGELYAVPESALPALDLFEEVDKGLYRRAQRGFPTPKPKDILDPKARTHRKSLV